MVVTHARLPVASTGREILSVRVRFKSVPHTLNLTSWARYEQEGKETVLIQAQRAKCDGYSLAASTSQAAKVQRFHPLSSVHSLLVSY